MNQLSRINRSFASLLAAAGVGVPMVLPLPAVGQTTAQRALPLPNSGKATPLVDAPTLVTTYGIDEDLAQQVAADLVARADLGFSTDPQLVIDLRTGKQNMSPEIPEVAMTLTEADEFFVRQSLVDDAQILDERLRSGPLASVYGGQFIDHANGVLIIQAVAGTGVEKVQAALAGDVGRSLPHRDRIEVRQV